MKQVLNLAFWSFLAGGLGGLANVAVFGPAKAQGMWATYTVVCPLMAGKYFLRRTPRLEELGSAASAAVIGYLLVAAALNGWRLG